jgi:pyruvate ferredoxin oxidoreductase alpha subunit
MGKRVGLEVSFAASEAVKMVNVDLIAAYPITPQTHIVERLSEFVNNGELDAEFVPVESEHSAMSVCTGAAAVGARTFTCTSSQGLILMSEIVYCTAPMRLPVVMVLANRSLSNPISIWNDHTDVMSIRDCGWIQYFAENGQDVFDHVIISYRVGEDRDVMLPVIVNMDGFNLSHVIEPVELLDQETVDRFLPVYKPEVVLDPAHPVTMGAIVLPTCYTETKKAQDEAVKASMPTILRAWKEFGDLTGRYYHPIEEYRAEDAEVLLVTMGGIGETAMWAVDQMREKGRLVGLLKIRLWRPFPFEAFRKAASRAKILVVVDRAVSYGGPGGPVASELRSALYGEPQRPLVVNFIAGLASRDVAPFDFIAMVDKAEETFQKGMGPEYEIYGVRE